MSFISPTLQKPYQWITSVYFFQSIPYVVVSLIATMMYQQSGMKNTQAALLTSLLTIPWVIKPLFAPSLERAGTKKRLTILTQLAASCLFFILGFSMYSSYFLVISACLLLLLAFVSAMHDIVSDGLYLLTLSSTDQKRYVALRSFFYQMGRLVIKGGLLALIGNYALTHEVNVWRVFFWSLGGVGLAFTAYHSLRLPETEQHGMPQRQDYFSIVNAVFLAKKLYPALLFIFLYNITEAQMQKIIPLFLLDKAGLGLNLSQVGEIYGLAGTLCLMLGIFISGLLLTRYSLSVCIKYLTLFLVLGHALFIFLSAYSTSAPLLYATLLINQLTVGLANGAYMGYLLAVANQSQYPMSMYTLCTAVMALSSVFFGAISGLIEQSLGYTHFFVFIFVLNGLLLLMTFRRMKHDAY